MAAIAKIKPGTDKWYVYTNHKGNRKNAMVGKGAKAEKLAKQLADRINEQLLLGDLSYFDPDPEQVPTVREYGEKYLKDGAKIRSWSLNTESLYNGSWQKHIVKSDLASMRLDKVEPKHILAWVEGLLAQDVRRGTIKTYMATLNGIFKRAGVDGFVQKNPCFGIMGYVGGERAQKKDKKHEKAQALTPEEKQEVLENAERFYPGDRGIMERALWELLFHSGLRIAESAGLDVADLDLTNKTVKVSKQYLSNFKVSAPVKNHEERTVGLTAGTVAALQRWLDQLSENYTGALFFTSRGNRLSHGYFYTHFKKISQRGTPHWCRHTYASLRLSAGHNVMEISRQLGHKDASITLKVYGHFMPVTESRLDELDTMHLNAPVMHLEKKKSEKSLKH